MNRIYFFIIYLLFVGVFNCSGIFQSGELFLKNGDTLQCEISVYEKDVFITPSASGMITYRIVGIKTKIDMSYVSGLKIGDYKYEYHTLPIVAHVKRQGKMVKKIKMISYFVQVVVDGDSQLLKHYYTELNGGSMNGVPMPYPSLTHDYYINRNGEISNISKIVFRKTLKEKFADCPNLIAKVKNKEFKYEDLVEVIEFANCNCQNGE